MKWTFGDVDKRVEQQLTHTIQDCEGRLEKLQRRPCVKGVKILKGTLFEVVHISSAHQIRIQPGPLGSALFEAEVKARSDMLRYRAEQSCPDGSKYSRICRGSLCGWN